MYSHLSILEIPVLFAFCTVQSRIHGNRQALKWDDTHFKDVNIKQTRRYCTFQRWYQGEVERRQRQHGKSQQPCSDACQVKTRLYIGQGENLVTPAQETQISPALSLSLSLSSLATPSCCAATSTSRISRMWALTAPFKPSFSTSFSFFFIIYSKMSGLFKAVHLNANHSALFRMFMITVVHLPLLSSSPSAFCDRIETRAQSTEWTDLHCARKKKRSKWQRDKSRNGFVRLLLFAVIFSVSQIALADTEEM